VEIGPRLPQATEALGDVRDPLPREIRDPSFASAVRGYDRHAVDAYVERVNRLIAELQVSGSPRAAVRHALERVGEQTTSILQRARETAEEITASAREEAESTMTRAKAEADDMLAAAEREAGATSSEARAEADELITKARAEADDLRMRARNESESTVARARVEAEGRVRRSEEEIALLREDAEARMGSLQAQIGAIADERRTLLHDVRQIGARLEALLAEADRADEALPAGRPEVPEPAAAMATDTRKPAAPDHGHAHDERPEGPGPGPRA
jgi:DivIVA domain-containing protein